jgi:predicted nucleotidyltransferase
MAMGLPPQVQGALEVFVAEAKVRYGSRLEAILLFGSMARGEGTLPDSDIDLAVIVRDLADYWAEVWSLSEVTARVSLAYDLVLAPHLISAQRWQADDGPFLRNVRREGIRL